MRNMIKPKIKLTLDKVANKKYLSHKQKQATASIRGKERKDTHEKEAPEDYRPHKSLFKNWLKTAITFLVNHPEYQKQLPPRESYEVYLRLVEEEEMKHLTSKYKHSGKMASVLSFACEVADSIELPYIGDIVMCGKVIYNEASEVHLDYKIHWGHLFIHSILHLLGWQHGEHMEKLENAIMEECGLPAIHN